MNKEFLPTPMQLEEVHHISNNEERIFAIACLEAGCTVYFQVDVLDSNIDFLVINPKNPSSSGKLVEVTFATREDIAKKYIIKRKKKKRKKVINSTGRRKERQVGNMKESGLPWTMMCRKEMRNIERHILKDPIA